jgi:voltage-gated potassium channel
MSECVPNGHAGSATPASNPPSVDERSLRIQRRFEWPIIIAALLTIPAVVIQGSSLDEPWDTIGAVLNWGTWLAFLAEFVVMMIVTPRRVEWLKRHPLDVAITFLTPPFAPAAIQATRVFRLLRLLRLVRVFSMRKLVSLDGIRIVGVLTLILIFGGGALFAVVESDYHYSTWDGIWWAITTITTATSADIQPHTNAGRAIAIAILFTGIAFIALLTAYAADRFVKRSGEVEGFEQRILDELREIRTEIETLKRR